MIYSTGMLWFWYSIIAVFTFAAQNLLMRVLAVKTNNPRIFSFVFNMWGVLFALALFIIQGGTFESLLGLGTFQYVYIALALVAYGLYERLHFFVRKGIDASTYSIIFRVAPAIAFLGSILFFKEAITLTKIFGALCAIGASVLLVYRNTKLQFSRALGYAFICAFLIGIGWMLDKPASVSITPSLYAFVVWLFPLFVIAYPSLHKAEVVREFRVGGWKVALTGFLNVVGYVLGLEALALADASKVIPIISTNGLVVVLGGIILLRERDHMWRKLIAAAVAFIGVLLLR